MITHLHPDCTCNHKPGEACNASCAVHGTHDGPGQYTWTGTEWVKVS